MDGEGKAVSRSRDKGTLAETGLTGYLQQNGWPYAERRVLAGAFDKGDITGTPGLAWEVKYANAGLRMAEWVQETIAERTNAQATHGILVIKPAGYGLKSVGDWFAVMVQWDFAALLASATELPVIYACRGPYVQDKLREEFTLADSRALASEIPVLNLRPRGQREQMDNWYRVTTVKHMVRLLRAAGFGDPL